MPQIAHSVLNIWIVKALYVGGGIRRLRSLYHEGSYHKVLKILDSEGDYSDLIDDREKLELYISSCYREKKPRKMGFVLKEVFESGEHLEIVWKLLQASIEEERGDAVKIIRNSAKDSQMATVMIDSIILEARMKDKLRFEKTSTKSVSNEISKLLNNDDFYDCEFANSTIKSVKTRVRKLYRSKKYSRVISWLKKVNPRDKNFESYKFLLLSMWSIGDPKKASELAKNALKEINDSRNIDTTLDILYTIGDYQGIIDIISGLEDNDLSFKAQFLLARAKRKTGEISEYERIVEKSKFSLRERIESGSMDVEEAIINIKDVGMFGDIDLSERLLFSLISNPRYLSQFDSDGSTLLFADLVRDTLDRQKRSRLVDSLDFAEMLIRTGRHAQAISELEKSINHGIIDSARLYELYAIAAKRSGKRSLILNLIAEQGAQMKSATVERLAIVLEREEMHREHRKLCEKVSVLASDSFKFLRSYFNVLEKDTGTIPPSQILIKISKKNKPNPDSIIYFIERYSKSAESDDIKPLIDTLRINRLTRIYCSLRVMSAKGGTSYLEEIHEEMLVLEEEEIKSSQFAKMFSEFVNICHRNGRDDIVVELINHFGLNEKFQNKITSSLIRSLISLGDLEKSVEVLEKFSSDFSNIERWRFMIEIGDVSVVEQEIEEYAVLDNEIPDSELSSITSILFKIGKFREYLRLTEEKIIDGDFGVSDLTKHYYSLNKIGEEDTFIHRHEFLKRRYSHFPVKRAQLAVVGYDFGIEEEYVEQLILACRAEPGKFTIPLLISKEFLKLERIDIAYFFMKKALIDGQRDQEVITIGREIQNILLSLEINPNNISIDQIRGNPIFTDVEVIRKLISISEKEGHSSRSISKTRGKKRIAIQSHTLDIGGAERQASLLLTLLARNKIKNSSFALITNKIPGPKENDKTYYPTISEYDIEISQYYQIGSEEKKEDDFSEIIEMLGVSKANRIKKMISIYSDGNFDIAHTWQDYCNIYGGIAALISGVDKIIMSARTLPPPKKGRLARRQGRSYSECYRLLLESDRFILTHNSDFGNREYLEWLDIGQEKSVTIHNGLDIGKWKKTGTGRVMKEEMDIPNDASIVGSVGRLTSDKRPWLFLKVAEILISNGSEQEVSEDLENWYSQNEGVGSSKLLDWKDSTFPVENLHFVLVGDGPQLERAKSIVENSKLLSDRVHLVGFSNRVAQYLSVMDCFLLTSKVEGLPNAIIEAQAFGIPIVSTDAGGSKECFIPGKTGLLAVDDSPMGIASNVLALFEDSNFSSNSKKAGRKFIKDKFGIRAYSDSISKLYGN